MGMETSRLHRTWRTAERQRVRSGEGSKATRQKGNGTSTLRDLLASRFLRLSLPPVAPPTPTTTPRRSALALLPSFFAAATEPGGNATISAAFARLATFAEELFGGPIRLVEVPGPIVGFAAAALVGAQETRVAVAIDGALATRLRSAIPGAASEGPSPLAEPTTELASALLGAALAASLPTESLANVHRVHPAQVAAAHWYAVSVRGQSVGHVCLGEILEKGVARGEATVAVSNFSINLSTLAALQPDDLLLLGDLPNAANGWPAVVKISESTLDGAPGDAGRSWRRAATVHGDRVVLAGEAAPPPIAASGEIVVAVVIGETVCDIKEFLPGDTLRLAGDVTGRAHLAATDGAPLVAGDLVGVGQDLAFRVVTNLATGRGLK